jgi:hypothetical protein
MRWPASACLVPFCASAAFSATRTVFLAVVLGFADGAELVLVGDVDLGFVERLGGGLLADGADVVGFVGDVGDVDVDEVEADLVEFGLDVLADLDEEALAVLVDLLDGEGGDGEAELAEDDFLGHVFDGGRLEAEQALGGVDHDRGLGADADGEGAGDVDTDVLEGEGVLQRDADGHRREAEVGVVLDQRPDERRAAVDALRGAVALDLAVDDEDAVGRAAPVQARNGDDREEEDEHQRDGGGGDGSELRGEDGTCVHGLSSFQS